MGKTRKGKKGLQEGAGGSKAGRKLGTTISRGREVEPTLPSVCVF